MDRCGDFEQVVQWIDRDHNGGVSRPLAETAGHFYRVPVGAVGREMIVHEPAVSLVGDEETAGLVEAGYVLFWEPTIVEGSTLADRWPEVFNVLSRTRVNT